MDDVSYFTLANSTLTGNNSFYSNDVSKTSDDVKYYNKAKYEKKGIGMGRNFTKRNDTRFYNTQQSRGQRTY